MSAIERRDALASITSDVDVASVLAAIGKGLTPRECEVLTLLMARHTYDEIGRELYVSVNTVKTHVSHLYAKLGVNNRAGAIRQTQHATLIALHGDRASALIESDLLGRIVQRLRATRLSLVGTWAATRDERIEARIETAINEIEQTIHELEPVPSEAAANGA